MALLITLILGLSILAGVLIVKITDRSSGISDFSLALAFGTMTALAAVELVPEIFEHCGRGGFFVVPLGLAAGLFLLKGLDALVPDHGHHHGSGCGGYAAGHAVHHHGHDESPEDTAEMIHIGTMSAIAIAFHNIIEGMAVYSVARESLQMGIVMALAVGLHNVPMGMILYTTLRKETKRRMYGLLAAAVLSTFVGGLLMAALWTVLTDFFIGILMSLTLGMVVYIVIFELWPHLKDTWRTAGTAAGFLIGWVLIVIGLFLE